MNTQERRYPIILESIVHDAVSNFGFKLKKLNVNDHFIILTKDAEYTHVVIRWSNQDENVFAIRTSVDPPDKNAQQWTLTRLTPFQLTQMLINPVNYTGEGTQV